MRPIHARSEWTFKQALRCAQYRVPKLFQLRPIGFLHALSLRYGLIGIAACHHLLVQADPRDELELYEDFRSWRDLVAEHVRFEVMPSLPYSYPLAFPSAVGTLAAEPVDNYLALTERVLPFEYYLEMALAEYEKDHEQHVRRDWNLFLRRRGLRDFHEMNRRSLQYALHFFERRAGELEEVPEIALLDE